MAFSRLSAIISLPLAAFRLTDAAATKRASNPACSALLPVIQQMQTDLFDNGACTEGAHAALRLAFHDAIGFSINGGKGGGADGSILVFNATETAFHANLGIDEITVNQFPIFQQNNLSAGDFYWRFQLPWCSESQIPAPDGTVPEPTDSVTSIINRFADAGFSVDELIALLASHTIAAADKVDPTIPGTSFDSTAAVFDTQVFLEVLLKGSSFPGNGSQPGEVLSPLRGELRLQSDFLFARDSRTACLWQVMIDHQSFATTVFKDAMAKLQVLGQDVRKLIDCSEIVPTAAPFTDHIKFPASFSQKDVEVSCPELPFPSLATVAGPAPTVAPVPNN